ncbi:MAG: hypothetical protein QNJ74_01480 [Trichodesmium sp. MO_231.B1]|nr:hypothetical protein [Trichodesmium sp. MO_231.B1]
MQSIKDRQDIKGLTKKQISITVNRNNKVRDYLNKAARYLINWCRKNQISTMVVGVNPGMKQNITHPHPLQGGEQEGWVPKVCTNTSP